MYHSQTRRWKSIEELERREKSRGNRTIGQAKKQLEYVHKNEIYDIEVNTFHESVEENSNKVIEALNNEIYYNGWLQTVKKFRE
jgi:chloramphenicol 3-O phosphotransferase